MSYLLGIDVGSSAAKVGLFSYTGKAIALERVPYPTATPRRGYKEQSPDDWWEAVRQGLQCVTKDVPADSILAIGTTGHISSLTFVDSGGMVLRPSIAFQDKRAVEEVQELYRTFSRPDLAGLLGIDLPPAPTWPLPRLLWIRKHEPGLLDRARYLLQAKDYINLRLTGAFASDPSSSRGMVNLSNNRPAEPVFAALGIPNLLPPLFVPEQVIGTVDRRAASQTGLKAGVPVVAGWNDLNASVLGSGVVEAGKAFDVTGTSEHIGIVTSQIYSAPEIICAPYLPGKRLLYGVTSCGGGSLEWFSHFSGKTIADLLSTTTEMISELLFLPYLEGERSPVWDSESSGVLLGLRSTHCESDVTLAILEGVAFSLRQILEILERQVRAKPEVLIVSGGASRVELWNQVKANVLGKQVVTLENHDAGILGAAMLSAVSLQLSPDLETAALSMTQVAKSYSPVTEARRHADHMYSLYCEVYPALRGVFSRLSTESLSNI